MPAARGRKKYLKPLVYHCETCRTGLANKDKCISFKKAVNGQMVCVPDIATRMMVKSKSPRWHKPTEQLTTGSKTKNNESPVKSLNT